MRTCGECFAEALELGKQVKHHSGEEGIDELWGEPSRAFTLPMEEYYRSRYIKVAQTMANIDLMPALQPGASRKCLYVLEHAQKKLVVGSHLINWVARARVPMPKSTNDYIENCKSLKARLDAC